MLICFTVAAGCATITEVLYFFIFWSYFMVKICCDSTADLLNEVHGTNLYSQRGVTVMPLYVQIGDEEYRDGGGTYSFPEYDFNFNEEEGK